MLQRGVGQLCPLHQKNKTRQKKYRTMTRIVSIETRKKLSVQKLASNNPNWKGGLPKCLTCGDSVSRYENKHCIKCYGKTRLGDKNPAWKGGVNSDIKHRNKLSLSWYHKNRPYHQNWNLKRHFGINLEDYYTLDKKQLGKCAICGGVEMYGKKKGLAVDHNHQTNKVRGLLCDPCNLGLGKFKDNPELLENAAKYLKNHL